MLVLQQRNREDEHLDASERQALQEPAEGHVNDDSPDSRGRFVRFDLGTCRVRRRRRYCCAYGHGTTHATRNANRVDGAKVRE